MHACPLSKGKAQVLVHDPFSSSGELPWLVASHKFSLGLVLSQRWVTEGW